MNFLPGSSNWHIPVEHFVLIRLDQFHMATLPSAMNSLGSLFIRDFTIPFKAAYSVTMNIFRKENFLFKSLAKLE